MVFVTTVWFRKARMFLLSKSGKFSKMNLRKTSCPGKVTVIPYEGPKFSQKLLERKLSYLETQTYYKEHNAWIRNKAKEHDVDFSIELGSTIDDRLPPWEFQVRVDYFAANKRLRKILEDYYKEFYERLTHIRRMWIYGTGALATFHHTLIYIAHTTKCRRYGSASIPIRNLCEYLTTHYHTRK